MTTQPALLLSPPREPATVLRWRPKPIAVVIAAALCSSLGGAIGILAATGMSLELQGFTRFVLLAAAMGAISIWCARRKLDRRLGSAAAIVGTATISLMLCGIVANAGLRLGLPLADAWLAAADGLVGFDAGTVIRAIAGNPPLTTALSFAYNTSGAAVVALIGFTLARGHVDRAWELAATAFVAMQMIALTSPLAPAWGAMRHFGLEGLQGHGLPAGAGVYQWPAFAHFYQGSEHILRLADMGGVVAFPSFHTVLGLIITQALAETRLRWLGIAWTAAIVLSAIPMGGHYLADLLAGAVVWLCAASLSRRFNSPSA